MSPSVLVKTARAKGLDMIAICDHNSAENVAAVHHAGREVGLAVIGGMEITSREEAHVLGIFQEEHDLQAVQDVIYENLPGENDSDAFGEQLVMDEQDNVISQNQKLLIGATDLGLEQVVHTIHEFGGLAIASHVDRPSFSILSQLGFIPDGLGLDATEVCSEAVVPSPGDLRAISSSDAHRLDEIGTRHTRFLIETATVPEIGMALKGTEGRTVLSRQ